FDSEKCRARPIVGSETFTIVRSTIVMKNEVTSSANARQRRTCGTDSVLMVPSGCQFRAAVWRAYRYRPRGPGGVAAPAFPDRWAADSTLRRRLRRCGRREVSPPLPGEFSRRGESVPSERAKARHGDLARAAEVAMAVSEDFTKLTGPFRGE